jgi:S-adenosylmethionine:tRNA ribosyltransferase-isomerase
VTPATSPRARATSRLVVWEGDARAEATPFADLTNALRAGDLVVVNDSGTLPASLRGTDDDGNAIEVRLLTAPDVEGNVNAVLFGSGDWRTKTEDRPPPPKVAQGATLHLGSLTATVSALLDHPRLLTLRFAERGALQRRPAAVSAPARPSGR